WSPPCRVGLSGLPAVGRLERPAARALDLVLVLPRAETRLPQRGVHDVRAARVDRDRGAAGVLILVEHPLPRDAAVERAVDAALGIRTEGMTEHGGEQAGRIER